MTTTTPRTLAEKVWADHLVAKGADGEPDLIYVDLHLVHEVTSPQAFDGLRVAGRRVRGRTSPLPPKTTTPPLSTSTSRLPSQPVAFRFKPCATTPGSLEFACTHWVILSRA